MTYVSRGATAETMGAALELAKQHGGKLVREAGGFWTYEGVAHAGGRPVEWFGSSTINAMAARGMITFTQFVKRRSRQKFPIEAIIAEAAE